MKRIPNTNMHNNKLKNIIEAILLASYEPLSVDKLFKIITSKEKTNKSNIFTAIDNLQKDYEDKDMCGDEGVPYFEFMRTQGWCEALRLVLGRNTLKTTNEESEE